MFNSFRRADSASTADGIAAVQYDDGGSGILKACKKRFDSTEFDITCDAKHTVWIKHRSSARSVGLSGWLLQRSSMDELLDGVEAKLGLQKTVH